MPRLPARGNDRGPTGARPLYASAASATFGPNSNSGLWYDKFCDRWKSDWTGFVGDSGKRDWIGQVANIGARGARPVGAGALIAEAVARLRALVEARNGRHFERTTAWRFVTGLGRSHPVENGFAWHHGLGTPYLAGSGLKGLARAYAREWRGVAAEDLRRMFGPAQESALAIGSVVFLDALPVAPVMLDADVMTPHYAPWYQAGAVPGDWYSPTPIPFLTVAPGQAFLFAVLPRDPAQPGHREDCAKAAGLLDEALQTLAPSMAGPQPTAEARAGAARGSDAADPLNWAGRDAIVYGELVRVIEDRGALLLVRFADSSEEEVERGEATLR